MSKKIFELRARYHSDIIDPNKESFKMNDPHYVKHLEDLVLKLVPIYDRYYQVTGEPKPPLNSPALEKVVKKTPALFQSWPIK